MSLLSKSRLVNLTTPDTNIVELRASNQKLHSAIKNLGDGSKQLINSVFPPPPTANYRGRIIIPGTPAVGNDILAHRYHVVLPLDPSGYWLFNQINLSICYITAKTLATTSTLSVDIKISQQKGTTPFKSLFKPGFNPTLPKNTLSTHNVEFAIGALYQDDIGRVDILATDGIVANIELVLVGSYSLSEVDIP